MKNKKYLPLYYKWMNTGLTPEVDQQVSALCDLFDRHIKDYPEFELLKPTNEDFIQLESEKKNLFCWASGSVGCDFFIFTPLRQNIVLLMAAMNGEL